MNSNLDEDDRIKQEFFDALKELKARYFGSAFFGLKTWIELNEITLPYNLKPEDLEDWEIDKHKYLSQSKIELDGIKNAYQKSLVERLDLSSGLQAKIINMLKAIENSKDAQQIARTLKSIGEIQSDIMETLKIDAYKSDLYLKNKTATESLLKEQIFKKREDGLD